MNTKQIEEQIKLLEAYINKGTVVDKLIGLCDNVLLPSFPCCDVYPSWELYSGECGFPIGNGYGDYIRGAVRETMHDRRTTHGKQRLALAKHCLAWCEKELEGTI
jgi:hypothetical protein